MKPEVNIFENPDDLAVSLASEFCKSVNFETHSNRLFYIALSGGSTPAIFLKQLAIPTIRTKIPWKKVHLFWGDERCVPPDHVDSNYGMTRRTLLAHISIPETNVHRILGEESHAKEVCRYSEEIKKTVPSSDAKCPEFDWIFLGLGDDGHTASIFPGSELLAETKHICAMAVHPITKQKRITLTLPVINNAKRITFLVTGDKKASIVRSILKTDEKSTCFPASQVQPKRGILEWYLDRQAAIAL